MKYRYKILWRVKGSTLYHASYVDCKRGHKNARFAFDEYFVDNFHSRFDSIYVIVDIFCLGSVSKLPLDLVDNDIII